MVGRNPPNQLRKPWHRVQSLLDLQEKYWQAADEKVGTQKVKKTNRLKEKVKLNCLMATKTMILRLRQHKIILTNNQWAEAVTSIASSALRKTDVLDYTFIDSCTHFRVWYSSNHTTPKYRHLKEVSQFSRDVTSNYENPFRVNGDHWKRIQYPDSHHSAPSQGKWYEVDKRQPNHLTQHALCASPWS